MLVPETLHVVQVPEVPHVDRKYPAKCLPFFKFKGDLIRQPFLQFVRFLHRAIPQAGFIRSSTQQRAELPPFSDIWL
jgi:hypothetical protein